MLINYCMVNKLFPNFRFIETNQGGCNVVELVEKLRLLTAVKKH